VTVFARAKGASSIRRASLLPTMNEFFWAPRGITGFARLQDRGAPNINKEDRHGTI
jgi:hypothetical protein